jgi:hypothetical protein
MFPTRWREGFQAAGSVGRAILSFARRSALGLAGAAIPEGRVRLITGVIRCAIEIP